MFDNRYDKYKFIIKTQFTETSKSMHKTLCIVHKQMHEISANYKKITKTTCFYS